MSNFCNPNNFKIQTATRHKFSRRHSCFESRSSKFCQLRSAMVFAVILRPIMLCIKSSHAQGMYLLFARCPSPGRGCLSSVRTCRLRVVPVVLSPCLPACLPACCTGELAAVSRYQSGEKRRPTSLLSESPHNRRARADVLTCQMSHNRNGASEWHGHVTSISVKRSVWCSCEETPCAPGHGVLEIMYERGEAIHYICTNGHQYTNILVQKLTLSGANEAKHI